MNRPLHESRNFEVCSLTIGDHKIRAARGPDGKTWFVGPLLAQAAGYAAPRDAVRRHVGAEHRIMVYSPDSERISGNPKTKSVTLIDETGGSILLNRSRNCPEQLRKQLHAACLRIVQDQRLTTADRLPTLFDKPKEPVAPPPEPMLQAPPPADDEKTILAKAVEIMNRQLQSGGGDRYFPHHVYSVSEIGKEYGMAAVSLNRILEKNGIQYSIMIEGRRTWMLTPKYRREPADEKYAVLREVTKNERKITCLFWTHKGRELIRAVLEKDGITRKERAR